MRRVRTSAEMGWVREKVEIDGLPPAQAQGDGRSAIENKMAWDLRKFRPQALLLRGENIQARHHAGIARCGSGGTGRSCKRWCQ